MNNTTTIINKLAVMDQLTMAATIIQPNWLDNYVQVAISKGGGNNYSPADYAKEVLYSNLSMHNCHKINHLLV
jgi:hypothetical protein